MLIPRPCSEVVVDTVLQRINQLERQVRVLDLCTGSGCLLLSILRDCTHASGVGVDVSIDALAVARRNAARCGVQHKARFAVGDVLVSSSFQDAVGDDHFDYIICNPPYISVREMATLPPSVKGFEPALALVAEDNGLQFYEALVKRLGELRAAWLTPKQTVIVMEVGWNQADAVEGMFSLLPDVGAVEIIKDFRGINRVVVVSYAE